MTATYHIPWNTVFLFIILLSLTLWSTCAIAAPVGDGVADDTAVIQEALNAAAGSSLVARLEPGTYRITGTLNVPDHVTLVGACPRWEDTSTRIIIKDNGFPAVRLNNGSAVKGLAFDYPDNAKGLDPVPYPPTILLVGINPSVEQIVFQNAWIGVSTPDEGANTGQAMLRELTGFVHKTGVRLDGPLDIVRIQDVHWFAPGFPIAPPGGPKDFYRQERVGFEFGRVDGVMMSQCFMIGGKTFLHQLATTGKGEKTHGLGMHVTQCWIEDARYGFLVEGICGLVLSDSQIYISHPEGAGVAMRMPALFYGSVIRGTQIRCDGSQATGIEYAPVDDHPRNHLTISACEVQEAGVGIRIGANARRVTIADTMVRSYKAAIEIGDGVRDSIIHDNMLAGTPLIAYASEAHPSIRTEGNTDLTNENTE